MSTSLLDRMLDSVAQTLIPELASTLLALKAETEVHVTIEELAQKSTKALLTPSERSAYASLVVAVKLIDAIQAKAREVSAGTT